MYQDDKILVYVGYPSDCHRDPPGWTKTLLPLESSGFSFFTSGGDVSPSLLALLKSRGTSSKAPFLAQKLTQGHLQRLVGPILSGDIERLISLASAAPNSIEYRLLLDLWVLSRSDIYVVDCDLPGGARCGAETVYANSLIPTVGVSDSSAQDPWYTYHLDSLVKSRMCASHLSILAGSIRASKKTSPQLEPSETAAK